MSLWRSVTSGLRVLLRRDAADRDLDDELRHYLAMAIQENERRGMTREAAERAARVHTGSLLAARTEVRASGWEAAVDALRQDLRLAVRGLRRSPGFTFVVVLSLALGVGANTTMFSIVNAVMWRPMPYQDADRLALIWTDDARRGLHRELTAYATIVDWRSASRAFSDLAYFSTQRVAPMSNEPGGSGRSRSALVSANVFQVLGVAPVKGRLLTAEDERERASVAVITYGFWQRWFGGAADVIGKSLAIEDASKGGLGTLTVVGVLPAGFYFPDKATELFTPATTYWRFTRESTERFPSWARRWTAVGRLAPGMSADSAREELNRIGDQLAQRHPSTVPEFPGFQTTVLPVIDSLAGANLQSALWLLLGAVGLVLLVVCANVANLQLARGAARQHELAVQRALGAGRSRIVRLIFVECAVLVIVGAAAGAGLACLATPALGAAISAYVPRMDELAMDGRVLAFTAAVSIASCLVFGIVPAMRQSATNAIDALREGGRGSGTARMRRSQSLLVFAECALAVVLLAGAGLLLRSLVRVQGVDPGFDPSHVLTLRLEFPSEPPPSSEERLQGSKMAPARARARAQAMQDMMARVAVIDGVTSVAMTDDLFVAGQGNESITIPGQPADQIPAGELNEATVTAAFFATMRVSLHQGRFPVREDLEQKIRALWSPVVTDMPLDQKFRLATPEPVVVNDAFVPRFFPGADPVGQRFCVDPTNKTYWYEIVGVVGDMHRSGLERNSIPEYFGPYFPAPNGRADLVVRTTRDPASLAPTVRAVVIGAMPSVAVVSASTADAQLGGFSAQRRLQTWLLAAFAMLAVALAAIGIFGLAHYASAERTREIGIRTALGATPGAVLRLLVGHGMRMPGLGIGVGLLAAAGLTRVLSSQLYEVTATDPVTFLSTAVVLALVAVFACYLATRRAARVNPVAALNATKAAR